MVMLRLVWGLLVLCVVAASPPRYTRQAEPEDYDNNNNNNLDSDHVDSDDVYDYYDGIDGPEIEIGTLAPDEDIDPSYAASLEEEEEEEAHEEIEKQRTVHESEDSESPIKPQLIPSGSGESGTLMGPSAQGEEELRLTPIDILQISADISGSGDFGSGASGHLLDDKVSGSGEPLGSGGSGTSGDISGSEDSGDLSSGISGLSGSDIKLIPGGEVELQTMFETFPQEASGDFEESGFSGFLVISGEPLASGIPDVSGESGSSQVPEDSGESSVSEELFVQEISGESGISGLPEASGDSGMSGLPDASGESGISGLPEASGVSGVSGLPEASGESGISGLPEVSGEPGVSGLPEVSGESGISGLPEISGISEVIEISKMPEPYEYEVSGVTEEVEHTLESGESGETEAPDVTPQIIPGLDEEEEIFLTTPITPQEGAGGEIGSGVIPDIDTGMSTCVLCTCLVGSVYCDDIKLDRVPPLGKETTYFYARYNNIGRISKSDFANLNKLKRIDLTSNGISRIDDDAFFGLPALEELILRENNIRQLPALPSSMSLIDASHNQLGNTGIQREAFKDMPGLRYLYLTDNNIDHIPVPLPESLRSLHLQNNNIQMMHEDTFCNPHDLNYIRSALEDIRLDGNPINLSRTPQAYICLPRIPIGILV